MLRIMLVFGTRPEAIKMAPLCHQMLADREIEPIICVSGQHKEMLEQALSTFDLKPDEDWGVMRQDQDLIDVTTSVLNESRESVRRINPDMILVHGDTTTAFATSLAAFYERVPVGHVEAGLRTYNLMSPFPEEYNRQSVSKVSRLHFAPTVESKNNLISEGVSANNIFVTGNTVIDALFWLLEKIETDVGFQERVTSQLRTLTSFEPRKSKFVLITGHRRENWGKGFDNICEAIKTLATSHPEVFFVYPVHLNPKVQGPVKEILNGLSNVVLLPPLSYEAFVFMLKHCHLVLTDSGGIQEEAPAIGKPVLVMRDTTERPEAIEAGTVELVGTNISSIVGGVTALISDEHRYEAMARAKNPYGTGDSSNLILSAIKESKLQWKQ